MPAPSSQPGVSTHFHKGLARWPPIPKRQGSWAFAWHHFLCRASESQGPAFWNHLPGDSSISRFTEGPATPSVTRPRLQCPPSASIVTRFPTSSSGQTPRYPRDLWSPHSETQASLSSSPPRWACAHLLHPDCSILPSHLSWPHCHLAVPSLAPTQQPLLLHLHHSFGNAAPELHNGQSLWAEDGASSASSPRLAGGPPWKLRPQCCFHVPVPCATGRK